LRYDKIDLDRRSYIGAAPFSTSYQPFTGRLGAVYDITPDINVYASYSKAAQPVSQLVSLSASQTEFSLQKGRQYEVGSKATLWDKKAELTVALFDIEKNDLLTSTNDPSLGLISSQIGAQVSQGTEIALALTPASDWQINANFAWTWKAEYEDFNENLGTPVLINGALTSLISRDGNTPPNVPKIVAGLFVSKNFGAWVTTAGLRHVGERQANNNNGIQMDAYTTLDASIGYRWEKLFVTLRGRNLTDEAYSDWANASGLVQRLAEPISGELEVRLKF
jgi:iron complex outermembrane receptor protein